MDCSGIQIDTISIDDKLSSVITISSLPVPEFGFITIPAEINDFLSPVDVDIRRFTGDDLPSKENDIVINDDNTSIISVETTQPDIESISEQVMSAGLELFTEDGFLSIINEFDSINTNTRNFSTSNFYKTVNNIRSSIHPNTELTPSIIKYIIDDPLSSVSNPYTINSSYIFSSIIQKPYTSVFTGIDETPTTVGYSVRGTDVRTWSIATYVDITDYSTFSSSNIPNWCKSIRVIMIGGGGTGAGQTTVPAVYSLYQYDYATPDGEQRQKRTMQQGQGNWGTQYWGLLGQTEGISNNDPGNYNRNLNKQTEHDQQHHHYYDQFNYLEQHQHYYYVNVAAYNQSGGGGGGGGAVYITSISTETYSQIQITGSSALTLSLKTNSSTTTITCNNGGNGGNQVAGSGGQVTASGSLSGIPIIFRTAGGDGNNRKNGINLTQGYSTTLNYGVGGPESTAGSNPYYRVYFLTN